MKPKRMSDDELARLIGQQIDSAIGSQSDDIARERSEYMDRYLGELYGDEEADRSQVVSTDSSDIVDSILPDLMEIFCGGDSTVKFEPMGVEDEEAAEQESEIVNYVFMHENKGFEIFHIWIKDALIEKCGFVKWGWDEAIETRTERYTGMSQMEIDAILQKIKDDGDEVEIIDQEEEETPELPEMTPEMGAVLPFPGAMPPDMMMPPA